jgi:hypothetical protein
MLTALPFPTCIADASSAREARRTRAVDCAEEGLAGEW